MLRIPRVSNSSTCLFICDIQDRFRPLIYRSETIIKKSSLLLKVANILEIPCIVTEQYSKALGPTVPEIKSCLKPQTKVFEKKVFSMMTEDVWKEFRSTGASEVILCGIESHVCVLQTALDLLNNGVSVHLVCDAISSQRPYDRACAIERMKSCNAVVTTTESVIFDLMRSADHPKFKEISGLVKSHNEENDDFKLDISL